MREILFRGKRLDNGEWITGDLWNMPYSDLGVSIVNFFIDTGTTGGLRVIPETIGQYTGLKDKNGKKIFEGDIIRTHFNLDDVTQEPFVVTWNEEKAMFEGVKPIKMVRDYLKTFSFFPEQRFIYEVIGNVTDNPELMEV